jgi:hypothetical protein
MEEREKNFFYSPYYWCFSVKVYELPQLWFYSSLFKVVSRIGNEEYSNNKLYSNIGVRGTNVEIQLIVLK